VALGKDYDIILHERIKMIDEEIAYYMRRLEGIKEDQARLKKTGRTDRPTNHMSPLSAEVIMKVRSDLNWNLFNLIVELLSDADPDRFLYPTELDLNHSINDIILKRVGEETDWVHSIGNI